MPPDDLSIRFARVTPADKPRIALAKAAGIATGHGITVDRRLQTSAPGIYAVGDCAEVDGVNLPFVQPLMAQARALAATLAGEIAEVNYPPMPVLVKTPAHPVVALPPAPGSEGRWRIESGTGGVCALYVDAADRVQGFALTGSETARRASLVQSMTA